MNIQSIDNQVAEITETQNRVVEACREIVERTAVTIQDKRYVCVEGWQAIAVAHGCFAGSKEVKDVFRDGELVGWKATGYIKRGNTIISTAEGFCGTDERIGQVEYSGRAMAQTRAISRACRSAFAHIVVMIDKDLKTTPAEEVPWGGFREAAGRARASNQQINYLKKLSKHNTAYLCELAEYYGKEAIDQLTSSQASDAISKILDKKKTRRAQKP